MSRVCRESLPLQCFWRSLLHRPTAISEWQQIKPAQPIIVNFSQASVTLCRSDLWTESFGVNPWIIPRSVLIFTMASQSSRNAIPGTPGDDAPPVRLMGAAAVANFRCHSLGHAPANSPRGVVKVVDRR